MKGTKHLEAAILVVSAWNGMRAQEGAIDLAFNPDDDGFGNVGDGANNIVY